jgi:hypothetical protein
LMYLLFQLRCTHVGEAYLTCESRPPLLTIDASQFGSHFTQHSAQAPQDQTSFKLHKIIIISQFLKMNINGYCKDISIVNFCIFFI